jgi:hypothetical protein
MNTTNTIAWDDIRAESLNDLDVQVEYDALQFAGRRNTIGGESSNVLLGFRDNELIPMGGMG